MTQQAARTPINCCAALCRYCELTELPADFVAVVKRHNPHITELDLTSNSLTTLPDDLAELKYLRVLRVKYNKLAAIPEAVVALQQLATLDVAGNRLTALPDDLAKLQALHDLDVSGNRLKQVPGAPLTPAIDIHVTTRTHLQRALATTVPRCASARPARLVCFRALLRNSHQCIAAVQTA